MPPGSSTVTTEFLLSDSWAFNETGINFGSGSNWRVAAKHSLTVRRLNVNESKSLVSSNALVYVVEFSRKFDSLRKRV